MGTNNKFGKMAAVWLKFHKCSQLLQTTQSWCVSSSAKYAKPAVTSLGKKGGKKGKLGPAVEKRVLPVETDAEKLVNYVCGSNILKEGENIKLAPDSEYPEWLWSLKTDKPQPLEEMDQGTLEYWRRLRKVNLQRNSELMKLRRY